MDAIDFIYERVRMCKTIGTCFNCPFRDHKFDGCNLDDLVESGNVEKAVKIVKKWSKENPRKTRQSLFLEQYPTARIDKNGYLNVCPCSVSATHRDKDNNCAQLGVDCEVCRREFWSQEVK